MTRSSIAALMMVALCSFACGGSKSEPAPKEAEGGEAAAEAATPVASDPAAEAGATAEAPADAAEAGADAAEAGADAAEAGADAAEDDDDSGEAAPALPASFEALGVELCDQYVADYSTCIEDKAPEAEREAQRRIIFENLQSWKQIKDGGSPAAEKSLQTGCKIAREQAKRATADWGCEW
ncbi:hypothetical protein G6O69_28920 [Pseudenhygromyxa sp. WMMC2535]|uniref:hypothetical protein n=1 Tax=Pseudenhygromyxa sp. WMMC2535 TaxID=2712867 RepID=UPI001556AB3A|nr:hypothetical protein [Pseudenhygromyxa sp. WMMC2535]NVB41888.1 hypothetical protein [Pseudenhygromyxa sp. WMMC2535]